MGEDLVLYKDTRGRYGLIDRHCAHRRADLSCGIVEEQGLRCHYHGGLYDATGRCLQQPFEEIVQLVVRPAWRGRGPGAQASQGRVCLWPNCLYTGKFEWRVPIDDENTLHVAWFNDPVPGPEPFEQERILTGTAYSQTRRPGAGSRHTS